MIQVNSGLSDNNTGKLDTQISFITTTYADRYTWRVTTPDGTELGVNSGQGELVTFLLETQLEAVAANNGNYIISVDLADERKTGGDNRFTD